jgi:hypothetical protein
MKTHSSWVLSISLIAVLGAAVLFTGGGSGQRDGVFGSFGDVPVASASDADPSTSSNVAGDKAWEVVGGPVKIGIEPKRVEATPSASMNRLPW